MDLVEAVPWHQSCPLPMPGLELPCATLASSDLGEHSGVQQWPQKDPLHYSSL